jgi:hypothetical protein
MPAEVRYRTITFLFYRALECEKAFKAEASTPANLLEMGQREQNLFAPCFIKTK